MLDTNVLISMAFFPSRNMFRLAECLTRKHTIVLSSFVVDELAEVATRKFPSRKAAIDQLLAGLSYELVYTPHHLKAGLFEIRDVKDYPVHAAVCGTFSLTQSCSMNFSGIPDD